MKVIVRGHQLGMTEALKEYAEKKLSKIEKFFDNIQKVQVELDYRPTKSEDKRNVAQVTLWVAGSIIRGEIASNDMYASIDKVFEKLEKQVVKHKEKLKIRKKKEKTSIGRTLIEDLIDEGVEDLPSISKNKRIDLTDLTPDQATLQMQLIGHDFYIYRNIDTGEINLVYERQAGDFGNLEINKSK